MLSLSLVLDDVENLRPEGLHAADGLRRDGQHAVDAVGLLQRGDRLGELVAAEAVGLGADDEVGALHRLRAWMSRVSLSCGGMLVSTRQMQRASCSRSLR